MSTIDDYKEKYNKAIKEVYGYDPEKISILDESSAKTASKLAKELQPEFENLFLHMIKFEYEQDNKQSISWTDSIYKSILNINKKLDKNSSKNILKYIDDDYLDNVYKTGYKNASKEILNKSFVNNIPKEREEKDLYSIDILSNKDKLNNFFDTYIIDDNLKEKSMKRNIR